MAEPIPNCRPAYFPCTAWITGLELAVKESITVYRVLTRRMGLTIGTVIFQKISQEFAPSMWAASNWEGVTD